MAARRETDARQVGAARVALVHQVELLHRRVERSGQRDGAGVVDDDVDAAEAAHGRVHGRLHGHLVAHVDHARQALAAGLFDCAQSKRFVPHQWLIVFCLCHSKSVEEIRRVFQECLH